MIGNITYPCLIRFKNGKRECFYFCRSAVINLFSTDRIKKDNIEVCKDCEFRHICTDCRAFTDSNSRPNARPSKCQYNPYISKWSHEEGYKTLEECGVISNEKEFSIDHQKIAINNAMLKEEEFK